jgi:ribosome-associated heat shock protein Hsp15
VRADKWLWVARITKTRGLAADALKSGRVTVGGVVAKPSREVRVGDRVEIRFGAERRVLDVTGLAERRGSATDASRLYVETPESLEARLQAASQRRETRPLYDDAGARPTKRDRRRLDRTRGRPG